MTFNYLKRLLKPLFGLVLLVFILNQLELVRLTSLINEADWGLLFLGFLFLIASNLVSAYRWAVISRMLRIQMPVLTAIRIYGQGITANTVLPGGILGGDLWRVASLIRIGVSRTEALLCVALDRISGLWVLGICSLVALIVCGLVGSLTLIPVISMYGLGLLSLVLGPVVVYFLRRDIAGVLIRTSWASLVVQLLAFTALWLCFLSLGQLVPVWLFIMACGGIFVFAAIPAAVGGFGARELGAIFFMGLFGVPAEVSFSASVFFGLMSSVQGLLCLYWWYKK